MAERTLHDPVHDGAPAPCIPTASSSMIGTASSRSRLTKALPIWGYGFCERRCEPEGSVCERLGGSLRRECLDFLIPFNQRHLQE